jgi:hypothetical protein
MFVEESGADEAVQHPYVHPAYASARGVARAVVDAVIGAGQRKRTLSHRDHEQPRHGAQRTCWLTLPCAAPEHASAAGGRGSA